MKKNGFFIILLIVAGVAIFLFLQNNFASAQTSGQKIVWKMHQWRPATQEEIPYMQKACDEIFKRSNGRLKIDIYPGFSLGYHRASWLRDIKGGVIDMVFIDSKDNHMLIEIEIKGTDDAIGQVSRFPIPYAKKFNISPEKIRKAIVCIDISESRIIACRENNIEVYQFVLERRV